MGVTYSVGVFIDLFPIFGAEASQALGLTIPEMLLATADEVIQ
jgi:hypothetical protein